MSASHTAIYLRQSLDRDLDEQAIDRQRDACHNLLKARGWDDSPAVEYVDNSISATSTRPRPAYSRMLADITAGRVGRIVCWHADRLYRKPRDLEDLIDLCETHAVPIATATGDLDLSNDTGRTVARILGAVAKGEAERKAARQRLAAKQRADQGKLWWPSRPLGYEMPDEDGNVALRASEAAMLRDAYKAVLAGESLHGISQRWNAAGAATPKGNRWRGAQLRQLLLNPRNAGLRAYRGEIVGPAAWPAIVEQDIFDAVAAVLADPNRRYGATRGRKYLLSGIARCGVEGCGAAMGSARVASGSAVYVCKRCQRVSRNVAKVDKVVMAALVERLSRPDAVDLFSSGGVDSDAVAADRAKAKALRTKLADLERSFADDDDMSAAEYKRLRGRLRDRLAEVEARLLSVNTGHALDGVLGADDVAAVLKGLPLDRQRTIVEAVLRVTILPTGKGRVFDPKSVRVAFGGVSHP